jgi:hypothetical protein
VVGTFEGLGSTVVYLILRCSSTSAYCELDMVYWSGSDDIYVLLLHNTIWVPPPTYC